MCTIYKCTDNNISMFKCYSETMQMSNAKTFYYIHEKQKKTLKI